MTDAAALDLCAFIDASPTAYHAVAECERRLTSAGFRRLDEREQWKLAAGDRVYVVRGDATIAALIVGNDPPDEAGFRLVGAHTDSPNLRLKPTPVVSRSGCHQLGVEVYGGVLLHTWLDRDLSIAGRVFLRTDTTPLPRLVRFDRVLGSVRSLAIHLNRTVNTDGLILNPQLHLAPIVGLEANGPMDLRELIAAELARSDQPTAPSDVLGFDLALYDSQPSRVASELVLAPRLDNLGSCHAGLTALLAAPFATKTTRGIVLFDHEEVGSRSAQGAASSLLRTVLARVVAATCEGRVDAFERAVAQSFFVSADMAHAVHPNYADKHEPQHAPLLGHGPVIKSNAGQSYATDGESWSRFDMLCRRAEVLPQLFVTRSDIGCGSTIGPITAAELGLRTVDVGNPMLSMHSIREACAASDVQKMIDVLRMHFS